MAKKNGHGYGAYTFRDKDPVIYQIQQMLGDTKLSSVVKGGGPSQACMRAWFNPEGTKRPQNATIEAAGRALGKERVWRNIVRRSNG
jgi:hypothetical protein